MRINKHITLSHQPHQVNYSLIIVNVLSLVDQLINPEQE